MTRLKKKIKNPREKFIKLNKIYEKNFLNLVNSFKTTDDIKKMAFYGVKYLRSINVDNMNYEELKETLSLFFFVEDILEKFSFSVVMNLFPIEKDYCGKKYECKDYYSTIEYLKGKDLHSMILEYGLDDFFWNYYNNDIMNFSIKKLLLFDRIRKFEGKMSLMEEFIDKFAPEVTTYKKVGEKIYMGSNGDLITLEEPKKRLAKWKKDLFKSTK